MEDRTQMMGRAGGLSSLPGIQPTVVGGTRTQMGGPTQMGFDPMRTQMGLASGQALQIECLAGNRYACAPEVSRDHALVILKSAGQQLGRRAPINVCLVIDRSGSMEGEPLEYVKRACSHVVDLLEPNDILSIVTFSDTVDVLMSARRVVNKDLVKEHIHRLEVGNTTDLYGGLMAGCMQIANVMPQSPGYVHRVLLLTDGEPTAGIKDYNSIVQQVAEQRQRGISITALGFGPDYNEELMAGIARRSGGNYYYIQRPDLIPEMYRRELNTMMTIVAKNIRLRFHLTRWSSIRQIYGYQPTFAPRVAEVIVPDIEAGTVRTVLAELEFERHPAGVFRVAKVETVYEDMINNRAEVAFSDCVFEFTPDRSLLAAHVNPIVRNELEIKQASQNLQKTMMGMRTQQLTAMGAMSELQKTRAILMEAGQTEQARQVDAALQALQSGANAEKTLMGTIMNLDQGKRQ